jgi:predicted transglutaminase-like cysteine proteinase
VSAAPAARSDALGGYALAEPWGAFLAEQRRDLARDVLRFVQSLARERYVDDGAVDHWPTLVELLRSAGDDCDGLELLSYHALRELGFPADRVYRAILHRPATDQHHMVTLWFENPHDPWVIDPTDVVSSRLRRLSRLGGWVPRKLFSESGEFTVTPRAADEAGDGALQAPRGSE